MEMDRRTFLRQASAAAAMFAMPLPGSTAKTIPMGVVVHSYGIRWNSKVSSKIYPGFQNALDLLNHCHQIGAGGIQVGVRDWASDFVTKIRDRREKIGLYLEGSIAAPKDTGDVARFDQDVKAAREAGAQVVRTVCSSGRRYEIFHSREDFLKAQKNALAYLQLAEPVLKKYQVKLAVENHKDWRAQELSDMIKQVSSEWIGVTLDFGNSISLLEDPMEVVETLAPHAFTTHVKDMGVAEFPQGFLLSEVPLGEGILDLNRMVTLCKKHNPGITFNLEMITRDPLEIPCLTDDYWSTFEDLSGRALARTLRMVKANPFEPTLPTVSQLSGEDRLAAEEKNIIQSFTYSKTTLGLK
jgi:sugar phosphate isomerase/epimerase